MLSLLAVISRWMKRVTILLVPSLFICGCRTQKTIIFLDSAWNRDYAKNACDIYKKNTGIACLSTPEGIATQQKLMFASAFRQTPACKDVTLSYVAISEQNLKEYENGWSLSFDTGIDGGNVDESNSQWQIIDNKNAKQYSEGSLRDAVEAATRICIVATGKGGTAILP